MSSSNRLHCDRKTDRRRGRGDTCDGARDGKVKVRRKEDEGDGKYNSSQGMRELLSPGKQAAAERSALGSASLKQKGP